MRRGEWGEAWAAFLRLSPLKRSLYSTSGALAVGAVLLAGRCLWARHDLDHPPSGGASSSQHATKAALKKEEAAAVTMEATAASKEEEAAAATTEAAAAGGGGGGGSGGGGGGADGGGGGGGGAGGGGGGVVRARAVVVATGASTRWLGLPGEEALRGRHLHSCARCDGPLYAGGEGEADGHVGGEHEEERVQRADRYGGGGGGEGAGEVRPSEHSSEAGEDEGTMPCKVLIQYNLILVGEPAGTMGLRWGTINRDNA